MSAKNRINPDHYKTGHPGAPRQAPKDADEQPVKRRNKKTSQEPNLIPGAAPVGDRDEAEEK
jgi:hypothetical protein